MNLYTGYWVGTFNGTNTGKLTVDLKEQDGRLVGVAAFREPQLGQYEYDVVGAVADSLALHLTPTRATAGIALGDIQVVGSMQVDGKVTGRWKSTIGTQGVFVMTRHEEGSLASLIPPTNSVFVVHGHDEGAMQAVARFLEKLGVRPVILQEQINRGMTVMEKFEDFAKSAGFAVVVMTPDDFGYPVNGEQQKRHRARQNVVLELGYFCASLGRSKTLVLTKGELELPSDVFGLVYEPMDRSEGWKIKLARELKGAGFDVDLNRAIA